MCAIAGLLVTTTRQLSDGVELRSSDSARLSDLVRAAEGAADEAADERDALASRVRSLQESAAQSDAAVAAALGEADRLATAAGLDELSGPGIVVTLTDAPRDAEGRYPESATPDDLVVHQQDVQSVLNALWAGGAEGIAMQDQRIGADSAPRCIGGTLLLGGRSYGPPYVITAVGDPGRLSGALAAEPGVRLFQQYAARYRLGYSETLGDRLTVPAYAGSDQVRFARSSG